MGGRLAAECLRHDLAHCQRVVRARGREAARRARCRRCGDTLRYAPGSAACAHCGAHNERNPPWWRDGRFPIWLIGAIACAPAAGRFVFEAAPASLLGDLARLPDPLIAAGLCAGVLLVGAPAAMSRVRRPPHRMLRTLLLVGLMVYTVGLVEVVLMAR